MNTALQPLENDLASLREVWVGALPGLAGAGVAGVGVTGAGGGVAGAGAAAGPGVTENVASMSDAGLIAVTNVLARLVRDAEAVLARVAGEVAQCSPSQWGMDSLAKSQGFLSPARLVAAAIGGALAAAARMVEVGKATALTLSMTGEVLPSAHPHVAAGVDSGRMSMDVASAITTMLDRVAGRADPEQAQMVERRLKRPISNLLTTTSNTARRFPDDYDDPNHPAHRTDAPWLPREFSSRCAK